MERILPNSRNERYQRYVKQALYSSGEDTKNNSSPDLEQKVKELQDKIKEYEGVLERMKKRELLVLEVCREFVNTLIPSESSVIRATDMYHEVALVLQDNNHPEISTEVIRFFLEQCGLTTKILDGYKVYRGYKFPFDENPKQIEEDTQKKSSKKKNTAMSPVMER